MEQRAALSTQDPKYMPIHRPYDFRRNERILVKHVDNTTWFKDEKLGDPFKDGWRSKIKYNWMRGVMNRNGQAQ